VWSFSTARVSHGVLANSLSIAVCVLLHGNDLALAPKLGKCRNKRPWRISIAEVDAVFGMSRFPERQGPEHAKFGLCGRILELASEATAFLACLSRGQIHQAVGSRKRIYPKAGPNLTGWEGCKSSLIWCGPFGICPVRRGLDVTTAGKPTRQYASLASLHYLRNNRKPVRSLARNPTPRCPRAGLLSDA